MRFGMEFEHPVETPVIAGDESLHQADGSLADLVQLDPVQRGLAEEIELDTDLEEVRLMADEPHIEGDAACCDLCVEIEDNLAFGVGDELVAGLRQPRLRHAADHDSDGL